MGGSCVTPGGYAPVAPGTQFTLTADVKRSLQLKLLDLDAMILTHRASEASAAAQVEEVRVVLRRHGDTPPDVLLAEYRQAQAMRETLARSRLAASNQALVIRTLLSTSQQLATLESVNALLGDVAGKFNLSAAGTLIATYRRHTTDLHRVNAKLTQAALRNATPTAVAATSAERQPLSQGELDDIFGAETAEATTEAPPQRAPPPTLPDVGQIPLDM